MGNCCGNDARPQKAPARPVQGGGGTRMKRTGSMLSTTGIMDEDAPSTTAPKLDVSTKEVRIAVDRAIDILRGERALLDARLPESKECRQLYYEQLVLLLRESVHKLNEEGQLGIGVQLPSHVYELLALVKERAVKDKVLEFPAEATHRAVSCMALKHRRSSVEQWLRALYTQKVTGQEGSDITALLSLGAFFRFFQASGSKVPIASLPRMLDASSRIRYSDLMRVTAESMRLNLEPLRKLYSAHASKGFLDAAGLAAFFEAYPRNTGDDDALETHSPTQAASRASAIRKMFNLVMIEEDVRRIQSERWTEQELFNIVLDPEGPYGAITKSTTQHVYQDMTRPLWEYAIYTTKNSWLSMRDVMTSDASYERLKDLLEAGCKCLELDISDGPDGEPCVHLAWTKSKRLSLRKCLQTIASHAFTKSPYPVMLRLYLHLGLQPDSASQMSKTASCIKEVLQGHLVQWSDSKPPPASALTPDALRGKFLIVAERRDQEVAKEYRCDECSKAVRANVRLGLSVIGTRSNLGVRVVRTASGSPAARAGITDGTYIDKIVMGGDTVKVSTPQDLSDAFRTFVTSSEEDEFKIHADQREHRIVISDAGQRRLGNYDADSSDEEKPEVIARCKKAEIRSHIKSGVRPYRKCPLDQQLSQLTSLVKRYYTTTLAPAATLTRRMSFLASETRVASNVPYYEVPHMLRAHLEGALQAAGVRQPDDDVAEEADRDATELDAITAAARGCLVQMQLNRKDALYSENFCPVTAWEAGVQLVACHPQRPDRHARLHQAVFRDNGACGYVLKRMRGKTPSKDLEPCYAKTKLRLRVLLAFGLRYTDACMVFAHWAGTPGEGTALSLSVRQLSVLSSVSNGFSAPWYTGIDRSPPSNCNAWDHSFDLDIPQTDELPCLASILRVGIYTEPSDEELRVQDQVALEIPATRASSTTSTVSEARDNEPESTMQLEERGLLAEISAPLHMLHHGLRCFPLYCPADGKRIPGASLLCEITLL